MRLLWAIIPVLQLLCILFCVILVLYLSQNMIWFLQ
eukprot:SAG11_NODE_23338_length_390_cov_1.948454_1_plen_35_part_10